MRFRYGVAVLWLLFFAGAIIAVIFGLRVVTDNVGKILVAIITGTGGVMVAIVTHALAQARERELEEWRRKQERYAKILAQLAGYVRSRPESKDEFAAAVLESFLIASLPVIRAVHVYMRVHDANALDDVVAAMREDLGLPKVSAPASDAQAQSSGDLTVGLFPPATVDGLVRRKE
jgi:hypothetical protein